MAIQKRTNRVVSSTQSGFTLIEIVIALVVFMIAVMGMVSLQGASINAASKSRKQTAAVSIARFVITDLKSEFAGWDKAQAITTFPSGRYPLLQTIFGQPTAVDEWIQYGDNLGQGQGDFRFDEFLGHSGLANNAGASRFCVNYRVNPIEVPVWGDPFAYTEFSVWQIRVRVSWTNEGAFQTNGTAWDVCAPATVEQRILVDESDDAVELTSMATRELSR
jgi:prepilin-type N-terminal cleavage/methylation domain-containing protein